MSSNGRTTKFQNFRFFSINSRTYKIKRESVLTRATVYDWNFDQQFIPKNTEQYTLSKLELFSKIFSAISHFQWFSAKIYLTWNIIKNLNIPLSSEHQAGSNETKLEAIAITGTEAAVISLIGSHIGRHIGKLLTAISLELDVVETSGFQCTYPYRKNSRTWNSDSSGTI